MGITKFGNKGLQRALNRWERDIIDEVKRIIRETAVILQREARLFAPEDSGYLRESIEMEVAPNGLSAFVKVHAEYSIYVEYGTGIYATGPGGSRAKRIPWVFYSERYQQFFTTYGMVPQPFWHPAVEIASDFFVKEMRKLGK